MTIDGAPKPAPAAPSTASGRRLIEVLKLTTDHLLQRGVDQPRLDAELLCAHALGLRRLDLYLQFDRPLREQELVAIRALLRRRAGGEPMAYLTGVREFYGRPFEVSPAVLIPRPDSETLVEAALEWAHTRTGPLRIADLGTGSGCLAVSLAAELPDAIVIAVDRSPAALEVARRNAERNGCAERVQFVQGSWWEPIAAEAPFDLVVTNPPYITDAEMHQLPRDVRDHEPQEALRGGPDGLQPYRDIATGMAVGLGTPAAAFLEVDPRRAPAVAEIIAAALPGWVSGTRNDLADRVRVVVANRG